MWARENCDGIIRVVIQPAKDPNAEPRRAASRWVRKDLTTRITGINEETGAFEAVSEKGADTS